jgi:hypothetical protein
MNKLQEAINKNSLRNAPSKGNLLKTDDKPKKHNFNPVKKNLNISSDPKVFDRLNGNRKV